MISVSIVIPVYNVSQYIDRCVDSILNQDNTNCDVECVFVNDHTQDDSMEIIHKKVDDYKGNIHFVFCSHETNKGLSAARNTGLLAAKGDYIMFLDSDDDITKDCLQKMSKVADDYPHADMILGNVFHKKYGGLFFQPVKKVTLYNDNVNILRDSFEGLLPIFAWNRLIRRNFLIEHSLFFVNGLLYEDMPWCYRLYSELDSMVVLPDVTYVYENNSSSITNTTNERKESVLNSFCIIINYILDHIYEKAWIDSMMYCFGLLLRTMDKASYYNSVEMFRVKIDIIKYRLLKQTFFSGKIFMFFFFLTAFKPLYHLYKFSCCRRYYNVIAKTVCKIELMIDKCCFRKTSQKRS